MTGRFEFALRNVEASQWQAFERLSRKFMAADYREMRTLASAAGDGGRDGMLFLADGDETVAIQMSLSIDWAAKIRRTAVRLDEKHSQVTDLIYLTSQEIGAKGDDLRRDLRKNRHLILDIRDRSWFVDRELSSPATREAADAFSRLVVDPLLPVTEIVDRGHELLSNHESRAALLYLVLQAEDDSQDRQLTKMCFDSLVRTALRETDNEHRMSRDEVYAWVLSVLPTHDAPEVRGYVDRALERLDRRFIRHWRQSDEFCMNYEERLRLADKFAALAKADEVFAHELADHARFVIAGMEIACDEESLMDIVTRARRVLEQFLFERGEAFVESVRTGQQMLFSQAEIETLARRDAIKHPNLTHLKVELPAVIAETVERAALNVSEGSQVFLRAVGDAYTLFAFLCETPNVQSAVSKLFSNGEFWMDTSAVLPLLIEELLEPEERRNTVLVRAMKDAGAKVFVTDGVVEEILHHVALSVKAWRAPGTWRSRTPFLYASYLWSGSPNDRYLNWLEMFRGSQRPEADLADYLREVHGIRVANLKVQAAAVDERIRWHASEYWRRIHERRRPGESVDPEVVKQLAERDLENFLGVYELRKGEEIGNPFGYRHWWLSLTRSSVEAAAAIQEASGVSRLDSPVLSYDFLTHYLAVGPARRQLAKSMESRLPMMMDTSLLDAPPTTLLAIAETVRSEMQGQDDRLIRRKIRDHLETEKLSKKRVGKAGMEALVADLRTALEMSRGKR
ncbi:MAG: hypothetical protein JWL72_3078 [Ilumatobacteraceae bacterium]|nr:hypothetical protein [Ilumatobacteraceae bacterium]